MEFQQSKKQKADPQVLEPEKKDEKDHSKDPPVKAVRTANCFDSDDGKAQMFVLVGKSFKGKSHFIKWLVFNKFMHGQPPWEFGLVFAKTKFNNGYDFLPKDKILQGYNERVLKQYVENIEKIIKQKGFVAPSFIIFDDLVGILNNQSQWFINFISTHRHYNISIVIAVQYLSGRNAISPIMREQTSVAVMFNSKTRRTLENLYESYGQLFGHIRDFKEYYMRVTHDPFVAMVYFENREEVEGNYVPMRAPAVLPNKRINF